MRLAPVLERTVPVLAAALWGRVPGAGYHTASFLAAVLSRRALTDERGPMQNPTGERRLVTLSWLDREGVETNRVGVPLRWLQMGAGAVLAALLTVLVLGATAYRLHQQSAALYSGWAALEQQSERLTQELDDVRREMAQARESLSAVRSEEAKIRSWLGLDPTQEDPESLGETEAGGKGSLGDEGLESVAPAARHTEAEGFPLFGERGLAEESRSLAEALAELAVYVELQKEGWDAIPGVSPVDGEHWVSSGFGWRTSPFTGKREFHNGLDMAGRKGTPVVAAANGRVDRVFNDSALGRGLSIDHGNGIRTIYGHMEKVVVREGERVTRGVPLGTMGSTGKRSTGPHLHYALKVDGQYVNPRNYLLDRTRSGTEVARR